MPFLPAHEQAVAAFLSLLVRVVAALFAVAAVAVVIVQVVAVPDIVSSEVFDFLALFVVEKSSVACVVELNNVCVAVVKMGECSIESAVVLHYVTKTALV